MLYRYQGAMRAEVQMQDLVIIYPTSYSRILVRDCSVPRSVRVSPAHDSQLTLVHTVLLNHFWNLPSVFYLNFDLISCMMALLLGEYFLLSFIFIRQPREIDLLWPSFTSNRDECQKWLMVQQFSDQVQLQLRLRFWSAHNLTLLYDSLVYLPRLASSKSLLKTQW